MSWGYRFREYVPVGTKLARGRKEAEKIAKREGRAAQPVVISGSKIAATFWGKAWCTHLEGYGDYANRLPRGRTYVRNGSVVDLMISRGRLDAIVAGSHAYRVKVEISPLQQPRWKRIRSACAESIDSLLDLLGGKFSDGVMKRLTDRDDGMFPGPREIRLGCSCPDGAVVCKHVAAVLYGVGSQLDRNPELLFVLRGVDHRELVNDAVSKGNLDSALGGASEDLAGEDLEALFGIELDSGSAPDAGTPDASRKKSFAAKSSAGKSASAKKPAGRKSAVRKSPRSPAKAASGTSSANSRKKAGASAKIATSPADEPAALAKSKTKSKAKSKSKPATRKSSRTNPAAAINGDTKRPAAARTRRN